MPYAEFDDVTLYYELSGPGDGELLLLITGQGTQMISWYPGFCALLEDEGFRLIRFDNRDAGWSTKFDHAPAEAPYTIEDMAWDTSRLISYLGYDSVHVVGASMGGMIAQQLAISFPQQVSSLCSIFSAPSLEFRVNDSAVWEVRNQPPARDRDGAIAQWIERERISGLDGFDEDWIERFAAQVYDRNYCPEGGARQMAAIVNSVDRRPQLAHLRVPTIVIHGRDDRLISYEGGIATAVAIPGAELHVYAGMGHQLKPDLWPDYVRVITRNATRANRVSHGL